MKIYLIGVLILIVINMVILVSTMHIKEKSLKDFPSRFYLKIMLSCLYSWVGIVLIPIALGIDKILKEVE